VDSEERGAMGPHVAARTPGPRDGARALLASAFGLGLSPVLPGTCGALLGLGLHYVLVEVAAPTGVAIGLGVGLLVSAWLNHALTAFSVRHWADEDPSAFVWDEVAGYLATALLTCWLPWWPFAPLAFGLFRVLDMIKVWPASLIDRRWHGPWGILLDDIVSAGYAAAVVHVAAWQGWIAP
jgi:phosphatidylglycerophosphatase A